MLKKIKRNNIVKNYRYKLRFRKKFHFHFNRFKYKNLFAKTLKGFVSKHILYKFNSKKINLFILNFINLCLTYDNNYKNNIIYDLSESIFNEKYTKIYMYKTYISMLYINNIKYNIINMVGLVNILNTVYSKKVNINIVKLKYLYLNNHILNNAVIRKLNDRKKRVLKVLKKALKLAKKANVIQLFKMKIIRKRYLLSKGKINKSILITNNHSNIINNIKYKHLIGIKLQGSGRLTKRLTASRSILKYKNKGRLKDIISSIKKKPSVVLKGYKNPSVQYLNINSYSRNGSFGLKSWLNSY